MRTKLINNTHTKTIGLNELLPGFVTSGLNLFSIHFEYQQVSTLNVIGRENWQ